MEGRDDNNDVGAEDSNNDNAVAKDGNDDDVADNTHRGRRGGAIPWSNKATTKMTATKMTKTTTKRI